MNTDSAWPPAWFSVVWNDSPGVVEKQLRFRQSFQSARPMSGRPCGPRLSTVNWNERTRCSNSGTSEPGSLSNGTGSSRIATSPVSLMYAATPAMSHSGSSLKPEPMSLFPRFVSGWYWWYAEPSSNCVDAMSMMRSRARSGMRCTKPSRSWLESRKPIPRPIPVSKNDAERDMLNVTMHWYWFQMLTIRSSFSSSDFTEYVDSRPVQCARSCSNAASVCSVVAKRPSSACARSLLMTWWASSAHFSSSGFSM